MKQRIIALIMIIPVVLMICVFSAANVVTLAMPIPVSGIELSMKEEETVNLQRSRSLKVEARALPLNAKDRRLLYKSEEVSGKRFAQVSFDSEGTLTARSVGTAKITVTTAEGGYSDSFLLRATSDLVTELEIEVPASVSVGDEVSFKSRVYPEEALDRNVLWSVTNQNILSVNSVTGAAKAKSSGTATVTASLSSGLKKSADLTVFALATGSGLTAEGKEEATVRTASDTASFLMEMNVSEYLATGGSASPADLKWSYDSGFVEGVDTEIFTSQGAGIYSLKATVTLKSGMFGETELTAYIDKPEFGPKKSVHITVVRLSETEAEFIFSNFTEAIEYRKYRTFSVTTDPVIPGAEVVCTVADPSVLTCVRSSEDSSRFSLLGKAAGVSQIEFSLKLGQTVLHTETRTVRVVELPADTVNFSLNSKTFGIENRFAAAKETVTGTVNGYGTNLIFPKYSAASYKLSFTNGNLTGQMMDFSVDKPAIASVSADGTLSVRGEGLVTVTAVLKAGNLLGKEIKDSVTIRCVNGVAVSDYPSLRCAALAGKKVVLNASIDVGVPLQKRDSSGVVTELNPNAAKILAEEVGVFDTTANWNYYKYRAENKLTDAPDLLYAMKFTNDVYGNGYTLNANNITNVVDSVGTAEGIGSLYPWSKFRGPLDLVSLSRSGAAASVKAQDNAAFLISGDNVLIDNVELKGATVSGGTQSDWNSLNYVGTTCEVIGKNIAIKNSKLNTGRTVLRAFGEAYEPLENASENAVKAASAPKLTVNVESCILSYAREFIIRMGTNVRQVGNNILGNVSMDKGVSDEAWEAASPSLAGLTAFNARSVAAGGESAYETLVSKCRSDPAFTNLVKTEMTLKNSVITNSGLFSIGLESSFGGPALDGGVWRSWNFAEYGWLEIASTSYPTRLNLEGSVRIYDWKDLENIDSSTLIEDPDKFQGGMLTFDIAEMIRTISKRSGFEDIVTSSGSSALAHGGIAMYGGGKNYCLVDSAGLTEEKFANYTIGLSDLGTSLTNLLMYAAGREPFRFLMYNGRSGFGWEKQRDDFASGRAYELPAASL